MLDEKTGILALEAAEYVLDRGLEAGIGTVFGIPKRFADMGCGIGHYCAVYKAYGWPVVHGYEGADIQAIATYPQIQKVDLSKKLNVKVTYDLVQCLEVGEHIPKEHEQIFLDNVTNICSDNLVLSWALPGQGGQGHVNEQPNEYIIEQLEQRGFDYDKVRSKTLRSVAYYGYLKKTVMVFRKRNR